VAARAIVATVSTPLGMLVSWAATVRRTHTREAMAVVAHATVATVSTQLEVRVSNTRAATAVRPHATTETAFGQAGYATATTTATMAQTSVIAAAATKLDATTETAFGQAGYATATTTVTMAQTSVIVCRAAPATKSPATHQERLMTCPEGKIAAFRPTTIAMVRTTVTMVQMSRTAGMAIRAATRMMENVTNRNSVRREPTAAIVITVTRATSWHESVGTLTGSYVQVRHVLFTKFWSRLRQIAIPTSIFTAPGIVQPQMRFFFGRPVYRPPTHVDNKRTRFS
jgi:hypothetical protein